MLPKEFRTDALNLPLLLAHAVDPLSGGDSPLWDVDWVGEGSLESILEYASSNGLEYFFLERWDSLGLISNSGNRRRLESLRGRTSRIAKTITMLNDISESSDFNYTVIKMPYMIPHVPRDIDIFVPDRMRKDIVECLIDQGLESKHSSSAETSLEGGGFAKVDVYSRITYFDFDFLDDSFFQASTEPECLFGVQCPILEKSADFAVELIHALFGYGRMTLLDYLNLRFLMDSANSIEDSRDVAHKFGWGRVFDLATEKLLVIHERIRGTSEVPVFPFPFDRGFIIECISSIENLCPNRRQMGLIKASLALDGLIAWSEESGLYEVLRSNRLARGLANSVAHSLRVLRGDKKTA